MSEPSYPESVKENFLENEDEKSIRATPHKESWWRRERNNVKIGI